ncbi:hypothetical protein BGZ83_011752 [Gryganskiella cystojenkinii]|nr:hypothetical protein BGZ83_011752 [Gryganskiella cystojenkinii]
MHTAALSLGLALALISTCTVATPVPPQVIFRDTFPAHQQTPPQHPLIHSDAITVLDVLAQRPEFSKLLEMIQKDSDLTKLLADPASQPTLFAPTNDAFDSISDIDYPTREVLMYHISSQAYNSTRLHDEHVIRSLYDSPGLDYSAQLLRISLEQPRIPSTSLSSMVRNSFWKDEPEVWIAAELEDFEQVDQKTEGDSIYVNRAKVIVPDLVAQSGGIVHGVNRIIRPPGETVLDEIMRRGMHFSYLIKAWAETGTDAHVRDTKSLTLFAAHDKAWKALPKKLLKWLFSNKGREHLKIFTMYQVGNKVLYTPEIFNKTSDDGKTGETYHEIVLPTLLKSGKFELHVQGQERKKTASEIASHVKIDYKPKGLTDLIEAFKDRWRSTEIIVWDEPTATLTKAKDGENKTEPSDPGHHYPHHDPNHPHHHPHRGGHHHHRHHRHDPHRGEPGQGGGGEGDDKHPQIPHTPRVIRRDDIIVNKKAHVLHGYENWIAGNGVIHVVDKVLMPPRSKGCEKMSEFECSAWETMWDLGNVGLEAAVEDIVSNWADDESLFDDMEEEEDRVIQAFWDMNENEENGEEVDGSLSW